MSSDYNTPDPANIVADNEWVRGAPAAEAPEEAPLELRSEPVPESAMPGAAPDAGTAPAAALEPEAPPSIGTPPVPLGLEALLESLLFVADGPVPLARLAEALDVNTREVEAAVEALSLGYATRGLSLQRIRDKVQLTTAPAAAEQVQRFLGLAASAPLSKAALETLAIVAYQQPVTRPQIEAVRGVNSDSVIKNLLTKGLIEESGRTEGPGRPVLYVITPEFLQHFGLTSLEDLPPLNLDGLRPTAAAEILKG
jgi:segregation and condensation protein B